MEALFLKLLNMSLAASLVALAVMALRALLKGAPKWISFSLWAAVLFRLVCPISFASALSLFGRLGKTAPNGAPEYIPSDILSNANPLVGPAAGAAGEAAEVPVQAAASSGPDAARLLLTVGACVWLAGVAAILLYSAISYWKLGRKLSDATRAGGNVYETDAVETPFVFGILRPRVYLPVGLPESQKRYVLLHEGVHIRRGDYIIKPIALLALALHWFNPVVWLAFRLMNLDLEMSCDERVIRGFTREQTADYGEALLRLRARRPMLAGSPLAFNENSTKGRIRNVLNYKKPAFWVVGLAVVAAAVACVCLISNPKREAEGEALATPGQTNSSPAPAPTPFASSGQDVVIDWVTVTMVPGKNGVEGTFVVHVITGPKGEHITVSELDVSDWPDIAYCTFQIGEVSVRVNFNVFDAASELRPALARDFAIRRFHSFSFIDDYLAQNASGCYDAAAAELPVYCDVDTAGYRYEVTPEGISLSTGAFYWHADELYIFALLNPESLHWQHYGLAWYMGTVNPVNETLFMLRNGSVNALGAYADTFAAHGGGLHDMDGKDYRILIDSVAHECLKNGMRWGTNYESAPLSELNYLNRMDAEGDDMSVMMAASFTAWLADEYGFDKVVSYCSGQTDFEGAYGAPFAELYEDWSGHILETYGE